MNDLLRRVLRQPRGMIRLFELVDADMQSAADQRFARMFDGTNYFITHIHARRRTGACSVACLGGINDQTLAAGNAIVAATQSWVTLASGVTVTATLAALVNTTHLALTPYLRLATPSTGACRADIVIYGTDSSVP